jgi:hypothetical protein
MDCDLKNPHLNGQLVIIAIPSGAIQTISQSFDSE